MSTAVAYAKAARPVLTITGTCLRPSNRSYRLWTTIDMASRQFSERFGWKPIDTAPLDKAVTLLVTDGRGEPYSIPYPSKRTAAGWVSSEGTPLVATPLQWKPYVRRQR